MIRFPSRFVRGAAAALALVFVAGLATEAVAKAKSTQTEARFVKFDAATNTIVVKPDKSKGPNKNMVKKGKETTFNVKPEGSVLTRTTCTFNGKRGEIKDIEAGKQVNVYWVPDENKKGEMFARKIDVVLSEEELDALYGSE